jgi:hypothetical protein
MSKFPVVHIEVRTAHENTYAQNGKVWTVTNLIARAKDLGAVRPAAGRDLPRHRSVDAGGIAIRHGAPHALRARRGHAPPSDPERSGRLAPRAACKDRLASDVHTMKGNIAGNTALTQETLAGVDAIKQALAQLKR